MGQVLATPDPVTVTQLVRLTMSEHSSSSVPTVKPERPEGSPLFWHASGRWAEKIRGKLEYFARGTHDEALAEYNRRGPDLHAGKRPREDDPDALTVYTLYAKFLSAKLAQRDNGEL